MVAMVANNRVKDRAHGFRVDFIGPKVTPQERGQQLS